jgi:hypothetical protein
MKKYNLLTADEEEKLRAFLKHYHIATLRREDWKNQRENLQRGIMNICLDKLQQQQQQQQ